MKSTRFTLMGIGIIATSTFAVVLISINMRGLTEGFLMDFSKYFFGTVVALSGVYTYAKTYNNVKTPEGKDL